MCMFFFFSTSDLALCMEKFGWFLEDAGKFVEKFVKLTMSFDLTWHDRQILSTCSIIEDKQMILGTAHKNAGRMLITKAMPFIIWGEMQFQIWSLKEITRGVAKILNEEIIW